jgi:uncharacterized protein (TIGR02217 family)
MAFLDNSITTYGASFSINYLTDIIANQRGDEQRRAVFSQPVVKANVGTRLNQAECDYIRTFFDAAQGQKNEFEFLDWTDYQVRDAGLGTGNGTSQQWQLVKYYTVDTVTVTRPIYRPIEGSLQVYVDDVLQESGWSCDYTTGILTTTLSGNITVSFDFGIPARFEQDNLQIEFDAYSATDKIFILQDLRISEVRKHPLNPILQSPPSYVNGNLGLGKDFGTLGGNAWNTLVSTLPSGWDNRQLNYIANHPAWNIGDRRLKLSELQQFIALFRCCRGRLIPFEFWDWQSEQNYTVRFDNDTISFQLDAYARDFYATGDHEAFFNLNGVSVRTI